ncbi:GDYXXLXY domain-containing protein [Flavobacterium sp. XS2P39]|uniref:GDYXXLXY domain-containing protein n=1 Tax=Flavobacterium sp. XS2P39 TaxID=3401725 RepID=UPI003AABD7C0
MKNKKTLFLVFILVVLAQLFVPLQMIFSQEDIIRTGKEFKFQTAPIDPYDPFRGKYITLFFKEREITVKNATKWTPGETVFATIITSKNGFAKITSISKSKPKNSESYLKLKIGFALNNDKIAIDFPFNRFYMNEKSAPKAEKIYQEFSMKKKNETYAVVAVKNGESVLKDIRINEVSIKDLASKK